MTYAHETCCAHLKIQYCRESLEGLTHDWWECASCKMLFAPQGRASLPQWIPISERMPTREDADELGEVVWKWAHGGTSAARFGSHPEGAVAWLPLPRYTPPKPRKWDAWDAADGSVRWSIWTSDAYSKPFQVVELTPAVRAALEKEGLLP